MMGIVTELGRRGRSRKERPRRGLSIVFKGLKSFSIHEGRRRFYSACRGGNGELLR